jgi:hypothetical protein
VWRITGRDWARRRLRVIEVYGASYFFEGEPEMPIIALWARRGSEEKIREIRNPYVYLGPRDTTWARLFADMKRPLVHQQNWQYAYYRNKEVIFHVESLEPLYIPEPADLDNPINQISEQSPPPPGPPPDTAPLA